jgi:hypothetical protein
MRTFMIIFYVVGFALLALSVWLLFFTPMRRAVIIPGGVGLFLLQWARNIHKQDDAGETWDRISKD